MRFKHVKIAKGPQKHETNRDASLSLHVLSFVQPQLDFATSSFADIQCSNFTVNEGDPKILQLDHAMRSFAVIQV